MDFDKNFEFCGEFLLMDNFDVRECLDWELMVNIYWYSSIIFLIKLIMCFFLVMECIFKEEGVFIDLKYIVVVEFVLCNVVLLVGVKGIW